MKVRSLPSYLNTVHKQWKKLQTVEKLYSEQKWLDSMSVANEMLDSMKDDFFGFYYRGLCNLKLKFFEEAIADFEKAKTNAEKNKFPKLMKEYKYDISLRIATVHRMQRNYEIALQLVNSTIKLFPNYSRSYILKANMYLDLERTIEALDSINCGLNVEPTNTELLEFKNYLVYVYSSEQSEKRTSG